MKLLFLSFLAIAAAHHDVGGFEAYVAEQLDTCAIEGRTYVISRDDCGGAVCDNPTTACTVPAEGGDYECSEVPADCITAYWTDHPTTTGEAAVGVPLTAETTQTATVGVALEAETTEAVTAAETTEGATTEAEKVDPMKAEIKTEDKPEPMLLLSDDEPALIMPAPTGDCEDTHEFCCFWATDTDECNKNPFWMRPNCQKACGTCGCTTATAGTCVVSISADCGAVKEVTEAAATEATEAATEAATDAATEAATDAATEAATEAATDAATDAATEAATEAATDAATDAATETAATEGTDDGDCADGTPDCEYWANNGECEKNPFWMQVNCQKSCDSCGTNVEDVNKPDEVEGCDDTDPLCTFWSTIEECTKNPGWMDTNCQLSCGKC